MDEKWSPEEAKELEHTSIRFDRTSIYTLPFHGGFSSFSAYRTSPVMMLKPSSRLFQRLPVDQQPKVYNFLLLQKGIKQLASSSAKRLIDYPGTHREELWAEALERPVFVSNASEMRFWIYTILHQGMTLQPRLFLVPNVFSENSPQFSEAAAFRASDQSLSAGMDEQLLKKYGNSPKALADVVQDLNRMVFEHDSQAPPESAVEKGEFFPYGQFLYVLSPDDVYAIPTEHINFNGDASVKELSEEEVRVQELSLKIDASLLPRVDVEQDVCLRRCGYTPFWVKIHRGPLVVETDMPPPRPRSERVVQTTSREYD